MGKQELTFPEKLYRYRSMAVQEEWVRNIFLYCEQYFSRPEEFNDPFDSSVYVLPATRQQNKKYLERIYSKSSDYGEKNTKHDLQTMIEQRLDNYGADHFREIQIQVVEEINNSVGLLCLSEVRDDILMWSHYSDGHKGFCLEFDPKRLLVQNPERYRVNYTRTYPLLNLATDTDSEISIKCLLTKFSAWSYEREWRFIIHSDYEGSPGRNEIAPESLTGVIFGSEMSDDDKAKIIGWISEGETDPILYQAVKKAREFGLDIVEYDSKEHDKPHA